MLIIEFLTSKVFLCHLPIGQK
uniref:Uncharacterized protein n=1 Tax=Arundo donax TaxID=35708 RepID=A0A0A8YFV9_ARUDO